MKHSFLKTKLLAVLYIGGAFIILISLLSVYYKQLDLQQPLNLTVNSRGQVYQGNRRVGQFFLHHGTQELRLPIADREEESLIGIQLSMQFPKPLIDDDLLAIPISIQGTNGMRVTQEDPQRVSAFFTRIYPESHTLLQLTVPAGYFQVPLPIQALTFLAEMTLADWATVSAITVLLALLYGILISRHSRIVATGLRQTPPEHISAMELAVLTRGHIRASDFSALLYDLANKGHLQIIISRDIFLIRQNSDQRLRPFEEKILNYLVPRGNKPPTLRQVVQTLTRTIFSGMVSEVYADIYTDLVEKGYFKENPRLVHLHYKTLGVLLQFFALFEAVVAYFTVGTDQPGFVLFGLALYIVGRVIYSAGYRVLPLSPVGKHVSQQSADFAAYLAADEPIGREGEQGYLFYAYLPHALALGTAEAWLRRFTDISFYIPSWYTTADTLIVTPEQFYESVREVTEIIAQQVARVKNPNVD